MLIDKDRMQQLREMVEDGSTITEIILLMVTTWGMLCGLSAEGINYGECWTFAEELRSLFPTGVCLTNEQMTGSLMSWDHAFVFYQDKYYDSETPEGVDDWRNLPCCIRCLSEDEEEAA